MFKVLRLGFVAGVGISGWVGGGIYERRRREHREHQEHIHREHRDARDFEMLGRIPGLPLGPKVSFIYVYLCS